jgi:hypothetical protein
MGTTLALDSRREDQRMNTDVFKGKWRSGKARSFHAEDGAIGYIALWLMGVPAGLLFFIFLLRGCN